MESVYGANEPRREIEKMWELIKILRKYTVHPWGYEKDLRIELGDLKVGILKEERDIDRYIDLFTKKEKLFDAIKGSGFYAFSRINVGKIERAHKRIKKEYEKHSEAYTNRKISNIASISGTPKFDRKNNTVSWDNRECGLEGAIMRCIFPLFINESGIHIRKLSIESIKKEIEESGIECNERTVEDGIKRLNNFLLKKFDINNLFLWKRPNVEINNVYI